MLVDRFLADAIEVDVDAICDGEDVLIGGIMEHIEQAGVHSGDSACSLPPFSLSEPVKAQLRDQARPIADPLLGKIEIDLRQVDEDQVAHAEPRVDVVDESPWRRQRLALVRHDDALGADRAEVQPHRRDRDDADERARPQSPERRRRRADPHTPATADAHTLVQQQQNYMPTGLP